MPISASTWLAIGEFAVANRQRITGLFAGHRERPFSGDINLDTMTVDICPTSAAYCARRPGRARLLNQAFTNYLRGTGPPLRSRSTRYLMGEINKVKEAMRLRPLTPTEGVAWGQQTPANQLYLSKSFGRVGGRRTARRRKKKVSSMRRPRRAVKRASRGNRFTRGSAAAKRHMAKLRGMRRRGRRAR